MTVTTQAAGSAQTRTAVVETVTTCRLCQSPTLEPVLDLGAQCIANAFHPKGAEPALRAPLKLVRCAACSLVQLEHVVDRDLMYRTYWYRSGINRTMREHLTALAGKAARTSGLEPGDTVLDIGCNDGTLLAAYPAGVRLIGVDPSNITPQRCDTFVNTYFTSGAVLPVLGKDRCKIITSIAMFYDLNDPRSFAQDIRAALRDDGIWVLELSYLPQMMRQVSYDTICHEHVTYYRLQTFERVLEGTGLMVFDVEFNDCNGASFRLYVAPVGTRKESQRLLAARREELAAGLDTPAPYLKFEIEVLRARNELRAFLADCQSKGKTVYGYGASTKGQVTLQYCGVTADQLVAIAERNPDKFGLLTPGTDIPICSEEQMRNARPDYILVLPWHFLREFLDRERDYLAAGGRLVVPMPSFRILSATDN